MADAYLDFQINNLDTVQGRVHFNLESRTYDLRKRAKERIGKWRNGSAVPRIIENDLIRLQDSGQISRKTRRNLANTIALYTDKETAEGMSIAIKRMLASAEAKDSGITVNAAAKKLVKVFKDPAMQEVIRTVSETAKELRKSEPGITSDFVVISTSLLVFDSGLSKEKSYNKQETFKSANTMIFCNRNYSKFSDFFYDNTGVRPNAPLFVSKTLKESGLYLPSDNTCQIKNNIANVHLTPVHELSHNLQYTLDTEQSKISAYSKKHDGVMWNVIIEGSAVFSSVVYEAGLNGKELINPQHIMKSVESNANMYLNSDGAETKNLKDYVNKLYDAFKQEKFNVHFNVLNSVNRDYEKHLNNRYGEGLAVATLLYAVNDFDAKQTMKDLIMMQPYEKLIEKMGKAVKADDKKVILERIEKLLA